MAKPLNKREAAEIIGFLRTVKPNGFDQENLLLLLVSRLTEIAGQKATYNANHADNR